MPRFSGTLVEDAPASEPVRRPRFSGTLVEDMPQDSGGGSNGYKMARGAYLGALDGASLSFGDELGAGLGAASEYLASFLPGQPEGRSYGELRDQIRAQNRQAQEEAPGSYLVGQLAGGIASSAPIAGAGIVGGAARSTAAKFAISAGTGAGAGAVQGFGAGEGGFEARIKEAGIAAVVQAVAKGDIAPAEGQSLVAVFEAQRKAIEAVDVAERVTAIEQRLDSGNRWDGPIPKG